MAEATVFLLSAELKAGAMAGRRLGSALDMSLKCEDELRVHVVRDLVGVRSGRAYTHQPHITLVR